MVYEIQSASRFYDTQQPLLLLDRRRGDTGAGDQRPVRTCENRSRTGRNSTIAIRSRWPSAATAGLGPQPARPPAVRDPDPSPVCSAAVVPIAAIIPLLLLASIGTAFAEDTWVLWGQPYPPVKEFLFVPVDAFGTREDCLWEKDRRAETIKAELKEGRTPGVVESVCLPDTVDPRGPKTK
jgi:hypothetical protein